VAGFTLRRSTTDDVVIPALNAPMPRCGQLLASGGVASSFHARFDAESYTYRYRFSTADVLSPFERAYAWHVPGALAIDAMAEAARSVEGPHDFAAFQTTGGVPGSTDRFMSASTVVADADGLVLY